MVVCGLVVVWLLSLLAGRGLVQSWWAKSPLCPRPSRVILLIKTEEPLRGYSVGIVRMYLFSGQLCSLAEDSSLTVALFDLVNEAHEGIFHLLYRFHYVWEERGGGVMFLVDGD